MSSRRSRTGGTSDGTALIDSILISILDEMKQPRAGAVVWFQWGFLAVRSTKCLLWSVRELPAAFYLWRLSGRNSNPEGDV